MKMLVKKLIQIMQNAASCSELRQIPRLSMQKCCTIPKSHKKCHLTFILPLGTAPLYLIENSNAALIFRQICAHIWLLLISSFAEIESENIDKMVN